MLSRLLTLLKPTLEMDDVYRTLEAHGFRRVEAEGPLEVWEGTVDGLLRVVSIDSADAPYDHRHRALDGIIVQSGISRRHFYWASGKPLPYGPED